MWKFTTMPTTTMTEMRKAHLCLRLRWAKNNNNKPNKADYFISIVMPTQYRQNEKCVWWRLLDCWTQVEKICRLDSHRKCVNVLPVRQNEWSLSFWKQFRDLKLNKLLSINLSCILFTLYLIYRRRKSQVLSKLSK